MNVGASCPPCPAKPSEKGNSCPICVRCQLPRRSVCAIIRRFSHSYPIPYRLPLSCQSERPTPERFRLGCMAVGLTYGGYGNFIGSYHCRYFFSGPAVAAILAHADRTIFKGFSIGAAGHTSGEVVFNTAMTG